jgi:hypothetical protein
VTRIYATSDDLAAYTGEDAPADAAALLAKAARFLDSKVFRMCWFNADADGLPTDSLVKQAFTNAVCAQAAWWGELGDSTGAAGAGWGHVSIGSVTLGRSVTRVSAGDSPARQVAPEVWDVLQSPDLTTDRLWIGAVAT